MAWVYLLLAGAFEISFTTAMRFTEGFTKLWPSLLVLALATVSIYFVTKASELIPLGTAYAAWGGIGAIGTVVIGILYFDEPMTLWRMVFLTTLILSIAGLKLVTD
ncbi:multidrug efflux SMR transporter [uncultured Hyphomicrobium sp.]|uniref:DMT family transporter n=1 Tax=uncultured Hyphomicrobium sp. TaxID=194373 RepID=UPI0025E1061C|nr:multidrug efflux SMR transporter [uncultured Hyphomicrobium sp.]